MDQEKNNTNFSLNNSADSPFQRLPDPIPLSSFEQNSKKQTNPNKKLSLILIVVFFLVLSGATIFLFLNQKKSTEIPQNQKTPKTNPAVQAEIISDIAVTVLSSDENNLYAGSDAKGLYKLQANTLTPVDKNLTVFSLLPDKNSLYVGFANIAAEPVKEQTSEQGARIVLEKPAVNQDADRQGLLLMENNNTKELWDKMAVWHIVKAGNNLFFTTNAGVYKNGQNGTEYVGPDEILSFGLYHDEQSGYLYTGTYEGVWRYKDSWEKVLELPLHKAISVAKISNNFYAATTKGLFTSIDGREWSQLGSDVSLSSIADNKNGMLFFGGSDGLYRLTRNSLTPIAQDEITNVYDITWYNGSLYAALPQGLAKINTDSQ